MTDTTTFRGTVSSRHRTDLEACRALVSTFIEGRFPELFDKAGVALLEFAERAESNTLQGRLFEAMGLLQRRRPDIEHIFYEELNAGFQKFSAGTPDTRSLSPAPNMATSVELSLMEPDDMEESVAAENLIARANDDYFQELYALSQRLSAMAGGRKLKDFEIPAGPHHLVHSFRRALDGFDVEVKVKVILYALFGNLVIRQCRPVYNDYNEILRAAGVLPTIKPAPVRTDAGQTKAARRSGQSKQNTAHGARTIPDAATSSGGEHDAPESDLFDSILQLMSTRPQTKQRSDQRPVAQSERPPPAPERAAAAKRQVLSAINQAQAKSAAEVHRNAASPPGVVAPSGQVGAVADAEGTPSDYPDVEIDTAFLDRVRVALSQERQQILEQVDPDDLSPVDANLIDLIGMLFEYVLNDPVLPNAAKALLSHLHTPYLKTALIDRRLLVDGRHPARRLLDEMVEAGSQWVEEGNPSRGIFPIMQQIVDRILKDFADDVSLFEELFEYFTQATQDQQRRTATVEQRTQEAARGREKLHFAKQRASEQLQTLSKDYPIPKALSQFLGSTWLDHLVFILLREEGAVESNAWSEAVETADALVALFDQTASPSERHARIEQIPKLRKTILREIEHMGSYSHATVAGLWALLDNPKSWQPEGLQSPAKSRARLGNENMGTSLPIGLPQPDTGPDIPLSVPQKEMIDRLRKVRFGTWFEFIPAEGGKSRRIKLSWMSPLTSTCMFVDHAGLQAEIKTLSNLADEILSGRAKIIPRPKHPFIERALLSIRKILQKDDRETTVPNAG